jgi:hypothetical protein
MGIALEWARVGIEGMGAIEFGDLAKMAKIMIGEFVKHVG